MINRTVSFGAGKVHVFSDFDGTYCPAKHSSLHTPNTNHNMIDYTKRIGNFLNSTNNDIHFHVTTGRTFGEYNSISWLLKMREFPLPLPESFIAKNGSDEYIKQGTDKAFYKDGIFPFSYTTTNKQKEELIRKETNWDGIKIKAYIKELADRYHIRFVEADSENSVSDYGERSLYSEGKLKADEWKLIPQENGKFKAHSPIVDYVLGSRNDGNLKVNLIFSPDYGSCPERNNLYDNFMSELKKYLKDNGVKYNLQWEAANKNNHFRTSCELTPLFEKGALTKLFDTKLSVKQAQAAKDLVIVAGDGSNDFKMLNPLEYIDKTFISECAKKSKFQEFYQNEAKMLHDLKHIFNNTQNDYYTGLKAELQSNGFLKQIQDLPLCSLVIKRKNSPLQPLIDTFASIGKVVEIESGQIDFGMRKAIQQYANSNKEFRNTMSDTFTKFIFEIQKKNQGNYEKAKAIASKKVSEYKNIGNKSTKLVIGIIACSLAFIAGCLYYLKNIRTKNNAKY